jgi:3-mercaptopyruvate sulfurtransferase SseA
MGYEKVVSMSGGYTAWKNAGNKWVADRQFTQEQIPAMRGTLRCRKSAKKDRQNY